MNFQVKNVSPSIYRISLSADKTTFKAHFDFEPVQLTPHPLDLENRNCVAIARGPFIYCAETVDNGGLRRSASHSHSRRCRIRRNPDGREVGALPARRGGLEVWNTALKDAVLLRAHVRQEESVADVRDVSLTLVPYFMWANRGKSDLRVWLPQI